MYRSIKNVCTTMMFLIAAVPMLAKDETEAGIKNDVITRDEIRAIVQEELQKSIGYFDPFKILEHSDQYKDELKKIERELDSRKQQLKTLEETAMKKKSELETMGNTLTEGAKERKKEELVNLDAQYRIKAQSAQEYAENAEQKARMTVLKSIQIEAEELAKEEGRSIVLAGGVVYGVKPVDLTDKILQRLNAKYRAQKEKKKEEVSKTTSK
jgi:outer membrane protein